MTARLRSAAGVTVAAVAVSTATLAACGAETTSTPDPNPATVARYRELSDVARLAAAAGCRDRAAERASGVAARQLAAVDEEHLRRRLDIASTYTDVSRPFDRACAKSLPLVTPGLDLRFAGVTGNGVAFAYQTRSDRPLTIRGAVRPAPADGRVLAWRESGRRQRITTPIDAQGRFVFRDLRLRQVADNTFILKIDAPPNAPRVVRFSAICLDCIPNGSSPPAT